MNHIKVNNIRFEAVSYVHFFVAFVCGVTIWQLIQPQMEWTKSQSVKNFADKSSHYKDHDILDAFCGNMLMTRKKPQMKNV